MHPLRIAALAALTLVFLALPDAAFAQTRAIDLDNASGDSLLQVNDDGGFAVYGTFDAGFIPASGSGARMMWYPAKAAFRAGDVQDVWASESTYWDADSVGAYSAAFNFSTAASGRASVAMGGVTRAVGDYATAMGFMSYASGREATAIGDGAFASGQAASAIGDGPRALGNAAIALGRHTKAVSNASLAAGRYNEANTTDDNTAVVIGNGQGHDNRSDALVLDFNGNLTIAGTLTESSDRRLKRAIEPIDPGVMERLGEIRPVRFRFREGTGHPETEQIGLIAQEVQARFPQLVQEGADGYLSVSYSKLTAVLLKGMQEQQAEIDRLEAKAERVDELEARLQALERSVEDPLAAGAPSMGWLLAGLVALGGLFAWRRRPAA